ncbi:hypothetical protein ABPG72_018960 [Tetrahymena utriculariae]
MNRKNSGQEVGQANQQILENSNDLELYEVNFQQKKMSSKKKSSHQQEEYNYEEGNDDYINIYKETIKSEDEDQDTSQQQEDNHIQNQHHHLHHNHDNHDDDDDELDEVNGISSNSQRQRYATQDYSEQNHYEEDQQYQQANYAEIVRDQIQQHNHELEHISQDYLNQQIQNNLNGFQNESNQMPPQEMKTQLSKKSSSRLAKNNSSLQSSEQNQENIRFEKQLSKMTPEEAEIEYQNRCQKQLLELQQKQQSFKKEIDQSGTQSQANSSKQTFTIQSNNASNQMKPQQVSQTKNQENVLQQSQQQYKNQSLTQKFSQQSIKDVNSLEQLKTVKSSLMISSQETFQNNLHNTQANIPRLSQISETFSTKDSKVQTQNNLIKNSASTNSSNNNNNNILIKNQYHSYQNPTQQRPQSSQQIKQDHQTELLCNIYYHGMQVRQEKEEKLKNIQKEIEAKDLQKCTFKPKLTEKAQRLSLNNNNYLPIEDKTQIYMKRKQILIEKRIEEKKKEETVGCTFRPQINPKKYKSLPQDEQHNMSVYDRQIEWQKKVSEKNTERMKNSYASIMTPSKKTVNQTRNNSTQKKSNYNQQNNNSNVTITNSAKRLKGYEQEKGFFSEKRVSPAFLTYLNCKYDYNHLNSIDYQKNQEVPQVLTAKPQEKDQIYQVQNVDSNQNEKQNQKIQKSIEVCQELENNQNQGGFIQNNKAQHGEYTFGAMNQQSLAAWQQQEQNQQQGLPKNSNQPKIFQQKNKNQIYLSENIQGNQSVQSMKPKHSVPSRIDQIKQTINKSLQDQFQSSKSISKSSSNAQLLKQYSYQNTIPQKVSFSGISQLNNIVIQNNHYTLNDPNSQQDIDEFQIAKLQLGNNFYRQYKEKAQQNKNSSFQQAPFFSSKSQQIANQNNQKILYQQAIKINKEIKELQGQSRHENSQYLQQQQQQVLAEYDMNQINQ